VAARAITVVPLIAQPEEEQKRESDRDDHRPLDPRRDQNVPLSILLMF
jgi:hypothetical protein